MLEMMSKKTYIVFLWIPPITYPIWYNHVGNSSNNTLYYINIELNIQFLFWIHCIKPVTLLLRV